LAVFGSFRICIFNFWPCKLNLGKCSIIWVYSSVTVVSGRQAKITRVAFVEYSSIGVAFMFPYMYIPNIQIETNVFAVVYS